MRKLGDKVLASWTLIFFAFLYVPIIVMIIFSFNAERSLAVFYGLSLRWYNELFGNPRIWEAFWNSTLVALIVTSSAMAFAVASAYAVSRFRFRLRGVLASTLLIAIIVPEVAESLTLFLFYLAADIPRGLVTVILGQVVWFPLVYIVVRARMVGFDIRMEEAARVLGANELQTFFRVTLPLLLPGIVTGGLLVFVWPFDDLIKVSFTRPSGFETLPIIIWSLTGARAGGVTPDINALATLSLIISLSLAAVYAYMTAKAYKK